MAAVVALTNIKHDDQWVEAGEEITDDTFPNMTDEEKEALVLNGAVGEPTLTGAEAELMMDERMQHVDQLLQDKYGLSLEEVLATEDTAGEPVHEDGSPDGV